MLPTRLFEGWKRIALSKTPRSVRRQVARRTSRGLESLEPRTLLTVFMVTNTLNTGVGSLRQAMTDANQSVDAARIEFAIPATDAGLVDIDNALSVTGADAAADVFRILPQSALPSINNVNGQAVTLDATTQETFTGNTNPNGPEIELDGELLSGGNGLAIVSDNVIVQGLVINRFLGAGIRVVGADQAVIALNYLGTDATGSLRQGNNEGVSISSATNILIGGNSPASRNVISGNLGNGIRVDPSVRDLTINSNYIGLNAAGNAAVPNGSAGRDSHAIRLDGGGTNIRIGAPGAGNVISGNSGNFARGIGDVGVTGLIVQSNLIGTDSTGTVAIGNSSDGIGFSNATNVLIGGTAPGEGNVISANAVYGIVISGTNITIQGNHIGTDITGTVAMGNAAHGIGITGTDVLIEGNVISANRGIGVTLGNAQRVRITQNSIHSNRGLGIDINGNGVTPNDLGDADGGTNLQQNFPVLTSGTRFTTSTQIAGTINSTANSAFVLEFFASPVADASGFGEGAQYLGTTTAMTDGSGNASFDVSLPGVAAVGSLLTATATDAAGNTSEFSRNLRITAFDFGDAPTGYPTTEAEDGARHLAVGPRLGGNRDEDSDGLHSIDASGDDTTGSPNDEDGVAFGTLEVAQLGATVSVVVSGGAGKLDAWIDFNGDGTWDDPSEQIFASQNVIAGTNNLTFNVPSDVINDTPFARFRLSTGGGLDATGSAADGEVEDYQVSILKLPPKVSVSDVTLMEGTGTTVNAVFTISLSKPSRLPVGVSYSTANGTAFKDFDYLYKHGKLLFGPGQTSKTVVIPIKSDKIDELDEEFFFLNLTAANNATIVDGQGQCTITDDDAAPTLSIKNLTVKEGTGKAVKANFTVSLSAASSLPVTVDYTTADDTATATTDYTSVSGTLSFAPGQKSKTITVLVAGDALHELNETFLINLTGSTNATLAVSQAVGTIADNDATPKLSINNPTITEGNNGTVDLVFTVTLSAASGLPVTVNYATTDGTANATDYTSVNGSLTFNVGETTKTITVSILGDAIAELKKTFSLNLSGALNALFANSKAIGTILDND